MLIKNLSMTLCAFLILSPSLAVSQDKHPHAATSNDSRSTLYLTASEREAVLSEMRGFLESTAAIVKGVAEDDMQLVAESARKSGRSAGAHMPKSLHGKLPTAFKKLGSDTHRRFDALALDAEQLGDGEHALSQLSELLGNCVSCHALFRIEAK